MKNQYEGNESCLIDRFGATASPQGNSTTKFRTPGLPIWSIQPLPKKWNRFRAGSIIVHRLYKAFCLLKKTWVSHICDAGVKCVKTSIDFVNGHSINIAILMGYFSLLLPSQGPSYIYKRINRSNAISAILVYYQNLPITSENCAIHRLFDQLIREPAFNTLRTERQLGKATLRYFSFSRLIVNCDICVSI